MIDSYDFGRVVIDGKEYTDDVIIFPDHVQGSWWREEGHLLQVKDLDDVFSLKPAKLIIGTGYSGMMEVGSDVREKAKSLGIELVEAPSKEACSLFNKEKEAVLAMHLTC
jgi:hypothetical protein